MKNETWILISRKVRNAVGLILLSLLLLFSSVCFFAAIWYVNVYGRIGFDAVLFTLTASLSGVQSGLLSRFLTEAILSRFIVFNKTDC